jgi:2-furoyl-CoA dehydrogenase 2Fe-2S iron sulfur subunit
MSRLQAGRRHDVRFTLNGKPCTGEAEPRLLLTDFLRHQIGVTGTHVGCEHGVCGACTVEIDGQPARACLTLAVQIDGCEIRTVESLAPSAGKPWRLASRVQAQSRAAVRLLYRRDTDVARQLPAPASGPDEESIRDVLSGHLCRCTGYAPIVRAALEAAAELADRSREKTDA